MHSLFISVTSALQLGLLHSVQLLENVQLSEPGMLVLLGTVLLGIGSFGRRKLPQ
ncbi:MAG TPA: hypothetical protein VKW78_13890 [Terriglobales bacterium]|nr:hypothetical protein [Terriglobales bacterium]